MSNGMQKVRVIRNTVCDDSSAAIPKFSVSALTEQGLNAAVYFFHKGSALTISHDLITLADGAQIPDFDPLETLVHFCAKGKIRYTFKEHTEILSLFDCITFHALADDVMVEMLEDSVLLIASTPDAVMDPEDDTQLDRLMTDIGERDRYTRVHCNHVATYTAKIAVLLNKQDSLSVLTRAASLHDIGKVKVPDSILNKPGTLSDEEFSIMRQHPEMGYELLKDYIRDESVLQGVLMHHERLDGSGYPRGLKGDQINLSARILMVADVYDALTTDRVYRKAFTSEKALEIMQQEVDAGKLDADVLAALRTSIAAAEQHPAEP